MQLAGVIEVVAGFHAGHMCGRGLGRRCKVGVRGRFREMVRCNGIGKFGRE